MRKPICRQGEALKRLEGIVARMKAAGAVFIPTEQELCELVGTSRMTLRKVLGELEGKGVLEAGPKGRVINANVEPELKGVITFIARGTDWIVMPAWNRLWAKLESLARPAGWKCELKLYEHECHFDASEVESSDFIVYSSSNEKIEGEFKRFASARRNIVGVQEEHAEFLENVICLDNFEAGRKAAQLLLDSGYRKPALLARDSKSLGFIRRQDGFLAMMADAMPDYETPVAKISSSTPTKQVRGYLDAVDAFCEMDVDSLFVDSDELIGLAYEPFATIRKIPENFGLVTLAGSHESLSHHPPVTAVGHGSSAVAKKVLELLERMKAGRKVNGGIELIPPCVHRGATVRCGGNS